MKANWPDEWEEAIAVDEKMREEHPTERIPYMHWSRVPLKNADLGDDPRQADMFGNECDGVCST